MAEKQKETEGGNCKALCFKANAIIVKFVSKVCRCEEKWEKLEKTWLCNFNKENCSTDLQYDAIEIDFIK